jgi:hypothetical protein
MVINRVCSQHIEPAGLRFEKKNKRDSLSLNTSQIDIKFRAVAGGHL